MLHTKLWYTATHTLECFRTRKSVVCVCVCVYVPKNGKQHKPKNNANNEFSNLCMYLCYFIWGCACFFFPFPYHHHHHHCTGVQIFAALQTNMQTSFEMEFLPKIEYSLDFSSLQWKKTRARTIFFSLIRLLLFRKRNSFLEKYKFILACFGIDFFSGLFLFLIYWSLYYNCHFYHTFPSESVFMHDWRLRSLFSLFYDHCTGKKNL